jgi:ribA/ribD-fused uncharacterized protein
MKNLEWLLSKIESGQSIKYLFFWGHTPPKKKKVNASCLSQWYEAGFTVNGHYYPTAEHWIMAEKARLFKDKEIEEQILASHSPGEAKALGRKVRNFDQKLWEEKAFEIVIEGNYHKFSQNPELKTFLLQTKNRILVEASPVDDIWGIGMAKDHPDVMNPSKWKGKNLLGFALMEARGLIMR